MSDDTQKEEIPSVIGGKPKATESWGAKTEALREATIGRINMAFDKYVEKDTYLTEQEFSKYHMLFSQEARAAYLKNELTEEELATIETLSEEFNKLVHPYRPIHITDNAGHVIYSLPPLRHKLNIINKDLDRAMNSLLDSYQRDDGGILTSIENQQRTAEVIKVLAEKQDAKAIQNNIERTDQMVAQFHAKMAEKSEDIDPNSVLKQHSLGNTTDDSESSRKEADNPDDEFGIEF